MLRRPSTLKLFVLLPLFCVPRGPPERPPTPVKEIVENAIERSEELLYAADLDAALGELRPGRFAGAEPLPNPCRIVLAAQTAKLRIFQGIVAEAPEQDEEILAELLVFSPMAERTEPEVRAQYLFVLGKAYLHGRQRDASLRSYTEAAKMFAELGDEHYSSLSRAFAVMVEHLKRRAAGDPAKIAELIPAYEAEVDHSDQVGNKLALAYNLRHLGRIYLETLDDPRKAMGHYRRSLALREEIDFRPALPASYYTLGDIYGRLGRDGEAHELLVKSIELADEIGSVRYRYLPRMRLGELHEASGAVAEAARLYREALRLAEEDGYEARVEEATAKLRRLP